jgi:hypothetical protein
MGNLLLHSEIWKENLGSKQGVIWITLFVEPNFQSVVIKWSLAYRAALMAAGVLEAVKLNQL